MELEDKTLLPDIEKIETKFYQIIVSANNQATELIKAAKRKSQNEIIEKEKEVQKKAEKFKNDEFRKIDKEIKNKKEEYENSLRILDKQAEENINSIVDEIVKLIIH